MTLLTLAMTTLVSVGTSAGSQTIDLEFDGGSVQAWVTAIKAQSPTSNIVVGAHAADIYISEMHLHDVSIPSLMQLCNASTASPITSDVIHEGGAPIWVVSALKQITPRGPRNASALSSVSTRIFNVSGPSAAQGNLAVDMIRDVCAMSSDQPVEIRMITPSIMVVRGSDEQQTIAEDVLSALAQEVMGKRGRRTAGASNTAHVLQQRAQDEKSAWAAIEIAPSQQDGSTVVQAIGIGLNTNDRSVGVRSKQPASEG